ncbi:ABC transporter substrate-binding protein, partial [Delftia tsuruhatensis]|nr:ABC transporter substrate-binding protein [Delftia tsuruhatensis]
MTTMIGKTFVKTSFRTTASVIALAIASLTVPTLAQAKRMGSGGKSVRPASIGKAPAQPAAPAAPTASKAATPASPAAPATPATPAA